MIRRVKIKKYRRRIHGRKRTVKKHNRKIAVPPAWKNVKYHDNKPYLVTGIDKKGRTQYIYPKTHSIRTSGRKFRRIIRLEQAIPRIMTGVRNDISSSNNPEAEVVYTMYKTGFRPGSDKDTKAEKKAYGASTLLRDHVHVNKDNVKFRFVAKKGVPVEKEVKDKLLANIIRKRKESKRLFDTSDNRLRSYFSKKTSGRFKLKDLRTLKATTVAKRTNGEKKIVGERVAAELGNTPAVALGSYVEPSLIKKE